MYIDMYIDTLAHLAYMTGVVLPVMINQISMYHVLLPMKYNIAYNCAVVWL